jgi:hypothetical protein
MVDSPGLTRRETLQQLGLAVLLTFGVVSRPPAEAAPLTLNPFGRRNEERAPRKKKERQSEQPSSKAREPPKSKKSPTGSLSPEDQEDIDELTKRLMTRKSSPGSSE